jgi:diaminopimelate decarboxylase
MNTRLNDATAGAKMSTTDPASPPSEWEAPRIRPHRQWDAAGLPSGDCVTSHIDGVAIADLVECYGSPLYVASEQRLRANVRALREAFERHYQPMIHAWSYKTNYTGAICRILDDEGSWAEVVSGFEYDKARLLGVPGGRIIFNGPNKSRAALERAITEGARINVDHMDELDAIEAIARDRGEVVPVTLRLNFNTGFTEPWTRFGFNLEQGQAHGAATRIRLSPHLRLTGLHSHIGTFVLDPRAYGEQVRLMCAFLRSVEADGADSIDMIDIGGGIPSGNALQGIFLPPDQVVPGLDEFGAAVGEALTRGLEGRNRPRPLLVSECGRAVVDDAVSLVASVVGAKRNLEGQPVAILDAGVNNLLTALWFHHPVKLAAPKAGKAEETVLYGPLCMNIDVMRYSVHLPPLAVGDRLVFNPVGAYNNTQWLQFIEYRPAIALVHADGGHSVIREAETLEDMCRHDRLPPHLSVKT